MYSIKEFFFILPELFLIFSSVFLIILYPITIQPKTEKKITAVSFNEFRLLLSTLYLGILLLIYSITPVEPVILFQQQYLVSNYTQLLKGIMIITILILLLLLTYQIAPVYSQEHMLLTLFICLGGFIMISANNLLVLWLGTELQTFSFVLLISLFRHKEQSITNAMAYLVLSALMSCIFLLGIMLIYAICGSINLSIINLFLINNGKLIESFPILGVAGILCLLYFIFKLALFPLHLWSIHIFTTVNLFIIYQFAIISKLSSIIPMIKIITLFCYKISAWYWICLIIAFGSIIVGALGAYKEDNIKRFLAYSSINHFGWILLPLSLNNRFSLQIVFAYFFIYIFVHVTFLLFLLNCQPQSRKDIYGAIEYFSAIVGLKKTQINTAVIILFSFAGLPPLIGFFSKFIIFYYFIDQGIFIIPMILIPLAAYSTFYYISIIILIITRQTSEVTFYLKPNIVIQAVLLICGILHILSFLYLPTLLLICIF